MKLFTILVLLLTAGCRAEDTNAVTSKVVELDRDKDGAPDHRIETVYRGEQKVMTVSSKPNAQGVMNVTSRSYFAGGDLVSIESDEDRDGVLETLAVYRPGTGDMDVFTRHRDGSVTPVNSHTLAAVKKQNAAISELWDKISDTGIDFGKAMGLMTEAQKKIRDAEREKREGKK